MAGILGCVAASPGVAVAAGGAWGAPVQLSAPGVAQGFAVRVAVNTRGDAVATWTQSDGANDTVWVATRPTGGAWSAPVKLSSDDTLSGYSVAGIDAAGDSVVAWIATQGGLGVQKAAIRPAGGAWGAAKAISASTPSTTFPVLAANAAGDVVVAWVRATGSAQVAEAVRGDLRTGVWGTPAMLSSTTAKQEANVPRVAIAADGRAAVAWQQGTNGQQNSGVEVSRYSPGLGAWDPTPTDLALPTAVSSSTQPDVAVGPGGRTLVVWHQTGLGSSAIRSSTNTDGTTLWTDPGALTSVGVTGSDPAVAIGADGAAVAMWVQTPATGVTVLHAARLPADAGGWTALSSPVDPVGPQLPRVVVNGRGDVFAGWQSPNGTTNEAMAAELPAGAAAWTVPQDVGTVTAGAIQLISPLLTPTPAVDGAGDALVGSANIPDPARAPMAMVARVIPFDATPPVIDGVGLPARVVAGAPVTLSVTAHDAWSAIPTISWDLGDGATASGATLTHTYRDAGTAVVRVTVTDATGQTASTSRTLTVLPAGTTTGALAIGALTQSHRAWRTTGAGRRGVPVGTVFAFTLTRAADVRLTFTRLTSGHRAGGRCRASASRGPRCVLRTTTRGPLVHGVAGRNRVAFGGMASGHRLRPGRYVVTATATVAGMSARASRGFRILTP
ncbi:MAG: PKD domain-containing protein [Thermoleophilia bacterium]